MRPSAAYGQNCRFLCGCPPIAFVLILDLADRAFGCIPISGACCDLDGVRGDGDGVAAGSAGAAGVVRLLAAFLWSCSERAICCKLPGI